MSNLRDKGLDQVIIDFVKTGKPVMGICLGMQLLLTKSFENGECEGLNIIAGEVSALKPTGAERVPQIGWNTIVKKEDSLKSSILDSLESKPYFYFLHSYQVQVSDSKCSLAQTTYGPNIFSSVIVKDNVSGCQFHPELSAVNGLAIFKNFVKQ
jgi:glutamine amidotransferase